jgi:hypothetical protein
MIEVMLLILIPSAVAVANTSTFFRGPTAAHGLMGLGPNINSRIHAAIDHPVSGDVRQNVASNTTGASAMTRIFGAEPTTRNFLTMLLSRATDPDEPSGAFSGELTVSEVIPGYERVTSMPKLPVFNGTDDFQFAVQTDPQGIIGPDGRPMALTSAVPTAQNGSLVVFFDSGDTLPQVSAAFAEALYGGVPGAAFDRKNNLWTLPCNQPVNLSFSFGGYTYPVHPLDTNAPIGGSHDVKGKPVCFGLVGSALWRHIVRST